jgi:hypothetical protein
MAEDDEEQVIGVLSRCEVCGEKTLHVDGVCQDHKIVRRRKKTPKPVDAPPVGALETRRAKLAAERAADEAAKAARAGRGGFRRLVMLLVLGGLIWLMGATHILHGDKSGIAFCWKSSWSLADTLVDTDKPVTERKVIDALAACAY